MGNSLLDQLKKAGLVDEKRAKQARQNKRQQQQRTPKKRKGVVDDEARKRQELAAAEQAKRDRELEAKRAERKALKERMAQLKQLIEQHRVPRADDGVAYNFTDGDAVRRLIVSDEVRTRIIGGTLAIVRLSGLYHVVPANILDRVRERDADAVVVDNSGGESEVDGDDPYADYQVPDDLMW